LTFANIEPIGEEIIAPQKKKVNKLAFIWADSQYSVKIKLNQV